ncbi:MAG: hypothetical protein QG573_726, partial [Acidobacteriota bacterium]|nr:hypothetical protein [Acidobacteriota bacterium]
MSLRRRLFLLLGGLICLLLVGQWLLFRSLTRAVTEDVRTVAFRVGEEILSGFSYRTESRGAEGSGGEGPAASAGEAGTHVVIVTTVGPEEEPGAAPAPAAAGAAGVTWTEAVASPPDGEPQRFVLRRELHLQTPGPAA